MRRKTVSSRRHAGETSVSGSKSIFDWEETAETTSSLPPKYPQKSTLFSADLESSAAAEASSSEQDARAHRPAKNTNPVARKTPCPESDLRGVGPAATNNPAAVDAVRKLIRLVARDVRETPRGNVLLDLIKDVALGTLCGVAFLLILSSLDYHHYHRNNPFSVRSAESRLRASAHELLVTDPEWMKTIEESADVRFVDADIYHAIRTEIRNEIAATESQGEEYPRTIKKLEVARRELQEATEEYDRVLSGVGVRVDEFCDGCMATRVAQCGARAFYLVEKYGLTEKKAKVNLMLDGKCRKPTRK